MLNIYDAQYVAKVLLELEICFTELNIPSQAYEKSPINHDRPSYISTNFSRCSVTRMLVDPDVLFNITSLINITYLEISISMLKVDEMIILR